MARHAKDVDFCVERKDQWKHAVGVVELSCVELWNDDFRYTIRRIDFDDKCYIIDSANSGERETDAKVRYILDADLEVLEVHYILATDQHKPRCPHCKGVNLQYEAHMRQDVCQDCGRETV